MQPDLMGRIAAILRESWVPGLSDRAYAHFAPMVLPLVESGADAAAIAMRLASLEGEIVGRRTSEEHRLTVACKLQEAAGQRRR